MGAACARENPRSLVVMRKPAPTLLVLALAALMLALVPAALAANGGGKGGDAGVGKPGGGGSSGSTLTLVVLDPDDGGANYGEQVTFQVSTTATDQPQVSALCYQNGILVYSASAGFWDGYPWPWARNFTLQSSSWTGGAADCKATLEYWDGRRFRDLASLGFTVLP
jgi:hypothetical protein